jgi:hypothetical protein
VTLSVESASDSSGVHGGRYYVTISSNAAECEEDREVTITGPEGVVVSGHIDVQYFSYLPAQGAPAPTPDGDYLATITGRKESKRKQCLAGSAGPVKPVAN